MHNFKAGQRVTWTERPGYKLIQNRPFDCRYGECVCGGDCNGVLTSMYGTVERVATFSEDFTIHTEAAVRTDGGTLRYIPIERLLPYIKP